MKPHTIDPFLTDREFRALGWFLAALVVALLAVVAGMAP